MRYSLGFLGNSGFDTLAVNFNGSTYAKRNAALTGSVNGKKGLLSYWFTTGGDNQGGTVITNDANSLVSFAVGEPAAGRATIGGLNTSGGVILAASTAAVAAHNVWHHFMVAWDLNTLTLKMYIDNVDVTPTTGITKLNQIIAYNRLNWAIGAAVDGTSKYLGNLSEIYFNMVDTLDLTDAANRAKFIDPDSLKPVDPGPTAALITGSDPILYLSCRPGDVASAFLTNRGTGGSFTAAAGSLSLASSNPSD